MLVGHLALGFARAAPVASLLFFTLVVLWGFWLNRLRRLQPSGTQVRS